MRVFQNAGVYPAYFPRLHTLTRESKTFAEKIQSFLNDRYGAAHILAPIHDRSSNCFFTNSDDLQLQRQWALEQGLAANVSVEEILLAQIEHHRTEVFYNMDPMLYGSKFISKLPGCVRKSIAWRAAPSAGADFGAYDRIVCNFPGILESYRQRGWKVAFFSPAHDDAMDPYAANIERPIDVLFVGGYSRHHRRRALLLDAVAALREDHKIVFHLDKSRLTRIAESPLGRFLPLGPHRRPHNIRAVSANPIFGRALYAAMSQAKLVLNGAVDMAGNDRGNMRCFESMGCGALMISDSGNYPEGMVNQKNMLTYADPADAVQLILRTLDDANAIRQLASNGTALMKGHYTKQNQWGAFQQIVSEA